jgi:hypothetical protein
LELGFLDPDTERRLKVYDGEGNRQDAVYLKGPSVIDPVSVLSDMATPTYTLAGAFSLLAWDISAPDNNQLTLMTTWQVRESVDYDAIIFTTLQNAAGDVVAQQDHQPLQGQFPTSYWVPGQVVTDVVTLETSAPLTRPVTINLGMYTLPGVERLDVVDAAGNAVKDNVIRLSWTP